MTPATWTDTPPLAGFESTRSDAVVRGRLQTDGSGFSLGASPQARPSKLERLDSPSVAAANVVAPQAVEVPPAICSGYGSMNSIYFRDWEAGLAPWTVGTQLTAPGFDTPDWAVVGSLPDGRTGKAAFVANLNTGNCTTDDISGVLYLQSPPIVLPEDALVPRISFLHWFATEQDWDGANLRVRVNNVIWRRIETTAIEFNTYTSRLFSENEGNTNPLAAQPAYTGVRDGLAGAWEEVRVNLDGLANPGDTIELQFVFGQDGCDGLVGWYVDDFRVYSCSDELPPSDCGNGVLDLGEQCDDGNNFIDDGCSNTCQVETGWECTDPLPPGVIDDPGFEKGTPNPDWDEASTNFGTPICDEAACGLGTGTGPASGNYWAWFGGIELFEESSLSQTITIPETATKLTFGLEASTCDSPADYLEVRVDGVLKYLINGSSALCEANGYKTQTVDISAFANGGSHSLEFHAETFGENGDVTNFFVDDLSIPGAPSVCTRIPTSLTLSKVVVKNNGGTAVPSNWTLAASGPTPFSGPGPTVTSGPSLTPGTYNLSESGGPAGYTASAWVCSGGTQDDADTVTLDWGDAATCTITNDDIPPKLTLVKKVVNDNGGSAVPSDWTLNAGGATPFSGTGPSVSSPPNFAAGTYQLTEANGPEDYAPSAWVCVGGTQVSASGVALALGEEATCTITNDDIDPSTVVLKDGFEAQ